MLLRVGSVIVVAIAACTSGATLELPESSIVYTIHVELDPGSRELTGRETIRWTNPAPHPVDSIPLHLYLNGFANEISTWMLEADFARDEVDEVIERYDDPWGWSEPRSIRQTGDELDWHPIAPDDGNPFDRSLIEVTLARPIEPGSVLELEIEWDARLPVPMARTGGFEDFFLVAQWFPKIAAWRPDVGFNRHQFHARTEFFADFADWDVTIVVPDGWPIVATGSEVGNGRFAQRAVHDFAWCTGSDMTMDTSRHRIHGGRDVEIRLFSPRHSADQHPRWLRAVEASLDVMSTRVAPYPYDTLTVVFPPHRAMPTSGMEYPTLFLGMDGDPRWAAWPIDRWRLNEYVIAHEFAHQYFYGIVATNEFEDAFLDEGFTEFWGNEIMVDTFGGPESGGFIAGHPVDVREYERLGLPGSERRLTPLWSGPSYLLRDSIGRQFYVRPAMTLLTAQHLFGRERTDAVMAAYVERHGFGHPRFEDFLAVAESAGGTDIREFYLEAFTRDGTADYRVDLLETDPFEEPDGHFGDDVDPEEAIDPAALDDDTIVVDILDPGFTRDTRVEGRVERVVFDEWESVDPDEDWERDEDEYWISTARVEGPGWDHLPVDVVLTFADGATIRDRWDGRAPLREYRIVRGAPLSVVRVDPTGVVALDPDLANNSLLASPDSTEPQRWGAWLGGMFQLVAEGLTQWL